MPEFMSDLNRFAHRHLAAILLFMVTGLGASVGAGITYYVTEQKAFERALQDAKIASAINGTLIDNYITAYEKDRKQTQNTLRRIENSTVTTMMDLAVTREKLENILRNAQKD